MTNKIINEGIAEGVANGKGEVTNVDEGLNLAKIEVMNAINRLPIMSNIWALFNKDHKKEYFAELFGATMRPTIPQMQDLLYKIKEKYGLKADPTADTSAKSQRRKNRRERNKMENGENGTATEATGPKQRTIRGGENTLVLQDANGKITRYKIRKKGAPAYKDTGVKRPVTVTMASGEKVELELVLNPKAAQFFEGAKASNRVGFSYNENWYILDDDANYQAVVAFDEKPNKKNTPAYTELAAGSKIEVAEEAEAPTKSDDADTETEELQSTDEATEEVANDEESEEVE